MTKIAKIILSVSIAVLVVATSVTIVIVSTNKKHEPDNDSSHVHAFTDQKAEEQYLASPATCTERAKYYYSCACGEKGSNTFANGDALGHSFTNYTSDNNATCTQDGTKTAKCDRCGEVNTVADEDSKLEHNFDKQVVADEYLATPAACTEKAKYYYSCACGEKGSNTFTNGDALGHNFGEWETETEPTETKKGLKKRVCERENCGYSESKEIPELSHEHSYTEKEVGESYLASSATCTKSAVYYYSCRCGEKTDSPWQTFEYGNPKGHTEVIDEAVAATRTENGLTEGKHCSVCNEVLVKQKVVYATGSVGLTFDGNTVSGIGTCKDSEIIIPACSPEGNFVTAIGDRAFADSKATAIIIPETVTSIGTRAFYNCAEITEIHIPSSVTQIGTQIFYKASKLNTVYYDSSYSNNDSNPFLKIANIKKVVFGGKYIPGSILNGCTNIAEVEILNSVTFIGEFAFSNCSGLTSITIPNSVTSIGYAAFSGCSGLTSITIPNSVTSIGDWAFSNCKGLTSITIPDSVTSIGYSAFKGCSGLTSITIPDRVTSIGSSAFSGCSGLTSITIPDGVTSIGDREFSNCKGLTSITIPDSVTSIGNYAFEDCSNLTNVYITDLYSWCNISGLNHFMCYGSKNKKLYLNNELITDLVIPDSVTSIGWNAFEGCSGLTSITIPDSVTLLYVVGRSIVVADLKRFITQELRKNGITLR